MVEEVQNEYDVAIIGGGPAGATAGTLLKRYNPGLRVAIFEREVFPRDHIGESLLPPISAILDEMGCWDKVESANFPIKLGATYRWGRNPELWDFDFVPVEQFREEPRPAKFAGQRTATSFQVDRSVYDKILLDHAAEMGCDVHQAAKVAKVHREGDRVTALELEGGQSVTARYYIDASGNSGILRRAMGIECAYHPALQNIAIWDYWQNAEWAVKIGVGGTRIQVRSLPYGWIWFIPLGPTRTSIGLVVPVSYSKQSGKKPAELYAQALQDEPALAKLLANAKSEDLLKSTRDWSFLAERSVGENWFLIGESAGFADPILSAGVTMAHIAGQQVAYTVNEIEHRGDASWLKEQFSLRQRHRINTHIRFGDYWYTANSQLKELKEFTTQLAEASGLELTAEKAWDWIARGGFIDEDLAVGIGGFGLASLKESRHYLADLQFDSPLEKNNVFQLDLEGAGTKDRASYLEGRVGKTKCYVRGNRVLPIRGAFELLVQVLQHETRLQNILQAIMAVAQQRSSDRAFIQNVLPQVAPALEGMVNDGWVRASYDPREPLAQLNSGFPGFHRHQESAS
ncbi:NAD(P)/FAD-dependent oxidoreductase [Fimbriimonas ginsengisoli]|uniref:Putative halogenase n=1 Tax=Fimbriimonas ginsengisoli Gsoil 348 TaxID=661478 RepID=A0A068NYX0_FIMGI|nr:NAD(P)/FAD-dependent oxidoreductase [Fimbriimonas ginsengisoli]AIE87559.1 putative halogenase [Fimbriimonas ginsengisoli Gsoil 348]